MFRKLGCERIVSKRRDAPYCSGRVRNLDQGEEPGALLPRPAACLGTRIERIASEQTGITADTAFRLAKALGTTAQLWLNLQNDYDVQIAKRDLGRFLIASRP